MFMHSRERTIDWLAFRAAVDSVLEPRAVGAPGTLLLAVLLETQTLVKLHSLK